MYTKHSLLHMIHCCRSVVRQLRTIVPGVDCGVPGVHCLAGRGPLDWALRSGPQHMRVRRLFLHGNPQLVFPPPAVASGDSSSRGTASLRYFALLGQELRLPNTRTVAMMGKVGSGKTTR